MTDGLWEKTLSHLNEGNFTLLQQTLGGPAGFDRWIIDWFQAGKFSATPETLAEALSCSCMLGRTETAAFLIDNGVDPYAGMKTGLAGPHWAASSGRLDVVKMLIRKQISLEVANKYGGTVLGQALWSSVNEPSDSHTEIIECLLLAGADVEPGTLDWWQKQVQNAESCSSKRLLADSLKALGNILRRATFSRDGSQKPMKFKQQIQSPEFHAQNN